MSDHQCAECGKGEGETRFRPNGSGQPRKYCESCSALRRRRLRGDAPLSVPHDTPRVADGYAMMPYQGAVVAWDADGGMVCLTDLWRAAGSPANKEPAQWLRLPSTLEYIEACARRGLVMCATHTENVYSRSGGAGGGGGSWREKIVGLAYAQNLNADLYVACNQFVLEKWSRSGGANDELLRAIAEHLGILPRMEAKLNGIGQALAGAERIEVRQYHRGRIYVGLLIDALTVQTVRRELANVPDNALIVFIGQTKPGEGQEQLRIRDYGSKVHRMRPTYYDVLAAFDTDSPDDAERLLLNNPPRGAAQAILENHKRSQSFHIATLAAIAEYRQLSRPYYAVPELQVSWSYGPLQRGLW